jgi:hypothetical protein
VSLSACADRRRRPVLVEPLESRVLFAGIPQYPDLAPWVSQQRGYLYGWTIDTNQIPGRTLLRLSNAAINMGAGPMEINGGAVNPDGSQQVFQRVYASDGSSKQFLAGSFIYHAQHTHVHFEDFTQYNLRFATPDDGSGEAGAGELAATSDKVSFCLLDSVAYNTSLPGAPLTAQNVSCSNVKQGISVGWADLYDKSLYGQWIDVTDVASGRYWLEVVIDPMNRLAEANEFNNMARIMIDLHQGDGTLAGAFDVGVLVGGGAAETQAFHEFVGTMDTLDYYKFTVSSAGTVSLSLNELRAGSNADLYLLDSSGATLASSVRSGTNAESISRTVAPGTYYVLADQVSGDSTYTLGMTFTPTAGASEGSGADAGGGVAGDGSPTTPTRPGNGHGGWNMHGNDTRQSPAEQLFGDDEATRLLE